MSAFYLAWSIIGGGVEGYKSFKFCAGVCVGKAGAECSPKQSLPERHSVSLSKVLGEILSVCPSLASSGAVMLERSRWKLLGSLYLLLGKSPIL